MKKKASPWSDDEHAAFLRGLKAFGKGHWKEISVHFVASRTPTQVASHAQKYFIRIARARDAGKFRRRRRSVFDGHIVEGSAENEPDIVAPSPPPALDAVSMYHLVTSSYWAFLAAQQRGPLLVLNRTHEIRKPIPLRDATNVMHALLK